MVHRVVSIVDKRSNVPWQDYDYDRECQDDNWYGGPQIYPDARDCHNEGSYPPRDRFSDQYFAEDSNYLRNSPPPRHEDLYPQQCYSRDDLRHQLNSRSNGRPSPYFRNRGRGSGHPRKQVVDKKNKKKSLPVNIRDRSPARREPALGSSGSNSNMSFSPNKDKSSTYQQAQQKHKANVSASHTPSTSVEGSPHSRSSREKTPASVVESEEVAAASMEPKSTPVEDLKTHRLEAIKAKALEIEKHYRQDCETFCTVVKMLVDKEPSLDNVLQAPLDKNLSEMKQRCLDDLSQFVKELDEILEPPDTSA